MNGCEYEVYPLGEAILPADVGALYSYPDPVCEPVIEVKPVLALCVGDLLELSDCSEGFLDSCVVIDVRLDRDASVCS